MSYLGDTMMFMEKNLRKFTEKQLLEFNGSDSAKPIYLAIKGTVFDVTASRETYTPPKGYSVFAGRDASKALGKSSLKPEDCIADFSELDNEQLSTLNKWVEFFTNKYPVVGIMSF